jgi:hypothetical protein
MNQQHYRILSLSGGGVRGLLSAIWLQRLEEKLGGSIAQHFDLIAGSSAGAIIACGLGIGLDMPTIVNLYQTRSRDIFPPPVSRFWGRVRRVFGQGLDAPRYDGRGLETVLRSTFGDKLFSELQTRTIITGYDLLHSEALVFKTNKPEHQAIPIWQIAKASASAPVYFPAQLLELAGELIPAIDGGVVANNPTACAIAEGARINQEQPSETQVPLPRFVVAAFGTGEVQRSITIAQSQEWGALEWALPLINVLFDGSGDSVDYISRQLLADENYFRFQTTVPAANGDIDDASPENLTGLTTIAQDYLKHGGDALLDRLVAAIS